METSTNMGIFVIEKDNKSKWTPTNKQLPNEGLVVSLLRYQMSELRIDRAIYFNKKWFIMPHEIEITAGRTLYWKPLTKRRQ